MANNKDTKPETDVTETTVAEAETTVTDEAPAKPKRGKASERVPGGKTLSAYFSPEEHARIVEAGFVKRHRTDSKLVHAAVLEYIKDVELPDDSE